MLLKERDSKRILTILKDALAEKWKIHCGDYEVDFIYKYKFLFKKYK